jgi:CHAT domain-containing protein
MREKRWPTEASSHADVLLVAMPTTPGQNDLPFANEEVQDIANLLSPSIAVLSLKNPSKNDILSCLNEARTVHFACHGISSSIEPGQSMLCLNDWETEPLTVADIASLKLSRSQLAYLSACYAANNRSGTLLDEAIHISGACQMAGFPNVIATLWHVNDAHSSHVANEFYLGLLEHNEINAQDSAISLHKAVRHLRERLRREPGFTREIVPDPLVWAAYIHSGA